jgi:hypothetical protein
MTKYIATFAMVLMTITGTANASTVKTSGQAVTLCKSHIKENVPGVTKTKSTKIRSFRENHIITFAVKTAAGRAKTVCKVNQNDGSIMLSK